MKTQAVFTDFLYSFNFLNSGKPISDADLKAAQLARFKRIAILMEEMRRPQDARLWAGYGLEIDPNDVELNALRQRLIEN